MGQELWSRCSPSPLVAADHAEPGSDLQAGGRSSLPRRPPESLQLHQGSGEAQKLHRGTASTTNLSHERVVETFVFCQVGFDCLESDVSPPWCIHA